MNLYYPLTETDDAYKDICADVENWIDTSNYDERRRKRPIPVEKKQKKDLIIERQEGW